jgi:hypothetical protein
MRRNQSLEQSGNSKLSTIKKFVLQHKTKLILLFIASIFLFGISKSRANNEPDPSELVGAPIDIGRSFDLRAKNKDGDTLVQTLNVTATTAQLQKRVLVRGNWIKARDGKLFLVVNLDVKNSINAPLYAVSQDWIRLVEQDDKKKAPTAHQGTVEIRPLSTKETNVGFVVDEGQKQFKLEVGATDGLGEIIEIQL